MMGRRRVLLALCCCLLVVSAEDTPPGLVSKDSDQDLVAEATNSAPPAQKREAALSNSYGEPLPADAYGPPRDIPIIPDIQPAPVYGVPDFQQHQQTPPGAYGPPSPVVFPSQTYQGPPPPPTKLKPLYGPPKIYGPPKPIYGPPKAIYGPPKKTYGPPKQNLPKATYGAPFKPPKIIFSKNTYGPPKPIYGPPKPIYGPPKATYGPPVNGPAIPLDLPPINLPPVTLHQDFGINNNIDVGLNLPAPIYGTPLPNLPLNLKPNFPIPADTYGPPGHFLGPAGPVGPEIVQGLSHVQYGPPEPDPNPRPPHPGIPAPPTPPHVLYDGWKPIPGVSKPLEEHHHHHEAQDQYGPPPPPPPEIHINLEGNSLPNIEQNVQFSGAQISSGYSSVHQDALANIDLNAIVGGDSNHIDQSKTVFEAHYTESHGGGFGGSAPSGPALHAEPLDTYGAPPVESLSHGPYPASLRQQGAKGLIPPSGIYGVPPGSQYGAPPRPLPVNLPLPYGSATGGGHTGGNSPRHPIKFREPVPDGLLQGVGQLTHHKDHHSTDHHSHGPAYISPPIREVKDVTQNFGNHGLSSLSLSIEPSNLYSLPHSGNPIHFQSQQQPSNLYGSPIDSYSAPLLTVGDHTASGSNVNEVKATLDGSVFANLSNLDAAAILKHCPYHEAILKAAKLGDKIPSDLASSYVASLSSLGSTLSKNQQTLISPQNGFNTPVPGSQSVSYSTKDLSTASQSLVQTVINDIKSEKTEKNSVQKGKSIKDESKNIYKDERLQYVSQQIQQTSEKIKNLSEEAKQLQQKIVTTSQNINQVNGQIRNSGEIPVKGKLGSYAIQIQAADSPNGKNNPTIPHEQLLSEGLLQSILSAIEEPRQNQVKVHSQPSQISYNQAMNYASLDSGGLVLPAGYEPVDHTKFKVNQQKQKGQSIQQQQQGQNNQQQQGQNIQQQQQGHNIQQQQGQNIQQQQSQQYQQQQSQSFQIDQEVQSTNKDIKKILHGEIIQKHRGDIPYTECDLKSDHSINHSISVPAPSVDNIKPVDEIDMNDVAIYFDEKKDENEPVTEISVATSISENVDNYKEPEFGEKIVKKS